MTTHNLGGLADKSRPDYLLRRIKSLEKAVTQLQTARPKTLTANVIDFEPAQFATVGGVAVAGSAWQSVLSPSAYALPGSNDQNCLRVPFICALNVAAKPSAAGQGNLSARISTSSPDGLANGVVSSLPYGGIQPGADARFTLTGTAEWNLSDFGGLASTAISFSLDLAVDDPTRVGAVWASMLIMPTWLYE